MRRADETVFLQFRTSTLTSPPISPYTASMHFDSPTLLPQSLLFLKGYNTWIAEAVLISHAVSYSASPLPISHPPHWDIAGGENIWDRCDCPDRAMAVHQQRPVQHVDRLELAT